MRSMLLPLYMLAGVGAVLSSSIPADNPVASSHYLQRRDGAAVPSGRIPRRASLFPRQDNATYIADENTIIGEMRTNPLQAAKDVQSIPYLAGNASGVTDTQLQIVSGDSDEAQLPGNEFAPFTQGASTNVSTQGGWEALPQQSGFDLNRTWEVIPGRIMPFYVSTNYDAQSIKRAVITWPGKPRDSWKYAALYNNALNVVTYGTTIDWGIANGSVLIVSPAWLNEIDQANGSVATNELYWHGSEWEEGGNSENAVLAPPYNHTLSTYDIVDNFTDWLFNKDIFPNLNQVVIAGHSMGGQAAQRYALLKKQKFYDDNMQYWVGNPGSWAWLNSDRPYNNASCATTYDSWHYGIGGNQTKIVKYARKDVVADKQAVVDRYLSRKIHYALGLLDNGAGDTHCEAQDQGGNHLDRGSQFMLHLGVVNNGTFPAAHTVDFIANTSHQDYAMISANNSLNWLFANDFNVRNPDIDASNPGDKKKTTKSSKPKDKPYATHGNKLLATSLLGGSLLVIVAVFTILPFIFPANFVEDPPTQLAALSAAGVGAYEKGVPVASHRPHQASAASSQLPMLSDSGSSDYNIGLNNAPSSRFRNASNRRYL